MLALDCGDLVGPQGDDDVDILTCGEMDSQQAIDPVAAGQFRTRTLRDVS